MRTGEKGFVLVLVVIFLALGSLLVIPALRLAYTTLNIKQLRTLVLEDQYARDGAAEHAMWRLRYGGGTAELTAEGQTIEYDIVLNGITTHIVIQLRAEPALSGQALANPNFSVRPGSSVMPTDPTPGIPTDFSYIITMEELNPNLASATIDQVWDQLPPGFTYKPGTSKFEGGDIGDPLTEIAAGVQTIHWVFTPPITFEAYGQIKSLTFQAQATPVNNERYCNEVAFTPNLERDGKSAIITLGTPPYGGCAGRKVVVTTVTASPVIVPPNVQTTVTFAASFTNLDIGAHSLEDVRVVLAPGFTYDAGSAAEFGSNMNTNEPIIDLVNGRYELKWEFLPTPLPFAVDQVRTQTFKATTTPTESGSAYAEVFTEVLSPCAYAPCTLPGNDDITYSWQAGITIVPAYDVRSEAEITSGWGNSIPGTGVTLESWNVTSN